jgi:AraC-like DNA-binding protein
MRDREPTSARKRRATEDRIMDAVCSLGEVTVYTVAARCCMSESYTATILRGLVAEGALAARTGKVDGNNADVKLYRLASAELPSGWRCSICGVRHKVGTRCFRRAA